MANSPAACSNEACALSLQFSDHYEGEGKVLFKQACAMGLDGIVSKRALSPYKSGPSKFWLKTKNVVESELILLGMDYDNEGKPIAYLGRAEGRRREDLRYAGTAFLTLSGEALCEPFFRWNVKTFERLKHGLNVM